MKNISVEELNEILEKHEIWLRGEEGGERADLWDTDLRGFDLIDINLFNNFKILKRNIPQFPLKYIYLTLSKYTIVFLFLYPSLFLSILPHKRINISLDNPLSIK